MEKRFDVRVPHLNTLLLEQLADESAKTGIVESRLLVQYATRYVEMTKGGLIPLIAPGIAIAAPQSTSNGHSETTRETAATVLPSLDGSSLDSIFGDPD